MVDLQLKNELMRKILIIMELETSNLTKFKTAALAFDQEDFELTEKLLSEIVQTHATCIDKVRELQGLLT